MFQILTNTIVGVANTTLLQFWTSGKQILHTQHQCIIRNLEERHVEVVLKQEGNTMNQLQSCSYLSQRQYSAYDNTQTHDCTCKNTFGRANHCHAPSVDWDSAKVYKVELKQTKSQTSFDSLVALFVPGWCVLSTPQWFIKTAPKAQRDILILIS